MTTNKNFAQMSSKKLRELMQHAEPEDAKAIEELLKARGVVDNKRLDELMLEKYPHIVYTAEQSDEFLKKYEGDLTDEDAVAQDFMECVTYRKNFAVMSTKKLTALLKTASEDDAKIISALIKARQDAIRSFEDKFTIIKHVGKNDKFVVREFDNEDDAKKFLDLLRKSERLDFIKYTINQELNY